MTLALTGSGRWIVSVNGVDLSGAHNFEREAIERAANLELANPADVVEYRNELRVRVEAKAAAPVPPPVIVPSTPPLWHWDATKVAPFGIHAKPAAEWGADPRVTLVNVGGRPGVRLLTMSGDSNVFGSGTWERCDLRLGNAETDASEGKKQRWEHGIWLPDDYEELPMSPANAQPWYGSLLMDFHDGRDQGGQANAQLKGMPPTGTDPDRPVGLNFEIHGGDRAAPGANYHIGPIVRNVWLDFKYEVFWTSQANGYFNGWLNGKQFMAHKGPTLYTGDFAYLKLANYHTAFGKSRAVVHGAVSRW